MSTAWPQVSLGELCLMEKGTSPTLKTLPGEFPLVVTADFRRSADSWQIEGPAVCIPLISSTGHGDAALHRVHYQEGKFALANLLVALTPKDSSVCSAKYLYHLLMAKKDDLLVPLMQGTANVSLKEKDIATVEIPLPPLAEQQRIVVRIEELAAKVDEAQKLRRQSLVEVEALIYSESGRVFDDLLQNHPSRVFGDFAPHVTSGPRNWGKHYQETGLRFYRAQDICQDGQVSVETKVYVEPPSGGQGRSSMLEPGDLMLVITGATVGRCAIYRGSLEPGLVSQHVAICRLPADKVLPEFAHWGLKSPSGQDQLLGQRYGQGKPGLNLSNIKSLALPLPPLSVQRDIVAHLDNIQAKVNAVKRLQSETAAELDAMLPSILDKAFKGEL